MGFHIIKLTEDTGVGVTCKYGGKMKRYLGFDIGGSSMKSGLVSREGKIIEKIICDDNDF